jgi:hypothetical protein
MSLDGIEAFLSGEDAESIKQRLKVVRDTGMYSVVLLAVSEAGKPEPVGSGTLVSVNATHYVLTARHVWERSLKLYPTVGITLRTGAGHKLLLDRRAVVPFGPPCPTPETEVGPDLVFLRIPDFYVGTVEAYGGVFYNLSIPESSVPATERLETWFLLGAPASLAALSDNHASMELRGSEVAVSTPQIDGGSDFLDARTNVADLPSHKSLGGVSGGGLWKVLLYETPQGAGDSIALLRGVAFWQFPPESNHRVVRCHSVDKIRAAAEQLCYDAALTPIEVLS